MADCSLDYVITAAGDSPSMAGRNRLYLPSESQPQVVYLGDEIGEAELLAALRSGRIDAIARGEISNRDSSSVSGDDFAVVALDEQVETGGFTVSAEVQVWQPALRSGLTG